VRESRNLAPGLLLETEFVRHVFARDPQPGWHDSCCGPDNTAVARLWAQRRTVGELVVGAPGAKGRLGLWAMRQEARLRPRAADAAPEKSA
jgi:hypothetical protein